MSAADLQSSLASYFASKPNVVSAYLFGSRALNRTHAQSDVDVGVLLNVKVYWTAKDRAAAAVRMNAEIVGVTHVNEVDVVVLNDVTPELGATIVTTGERLHCVDEEIDRAAVRRLIFAYADLRPFLERTRRLKLASFKADRT